MVTQVQVPTIQKVHKAAEVPQIQYIDRVVHETVGVPQIQYIDRIVDVFVFGSGCEDGFNMLKNDALELLSEYHASGNELGPH